MLDLRLSDSFPSKILAFSRTQPGQFLERANVVQLLRSTCNERNNLNAVDPKDELDSRISTKKSLFEVELRTPKGSNYKTVNKQALTSGFSQTRKANGY